MASTTYISSPKQPDKVYVSVAWTDDEKKEHYRIYRLEKSNELYIHRDPNSERIFIEDRFGRYSDLTGINNPAVSRQHLVVRPGQKGEIEIIDLGSKFGTYSPLTLVKSGFETFKDKSTGIELTLDVLLASLGNYIPKGAFIIKDVIHNGKVAELRPNECAIIGMAAEALHYRNPEVRMLICNGYI